MTSQRIRRAVELLGWLFLVRDEIPLGSGAAQILNVLVSGFRGGFVVEFSLGLFERGKSEKLAGVGGELVRGFRKGALREQQIAAGNFVTILNNGIARERSQSFQLANGLLRNRGQSVDGGDARALAENHGEGVI